MGYIRTTAPLGAFQGMQIDTPTDGVAIGEVFPQGDVVLYAFAEADPASATNQFPHVTDEKGAILYGILDSKWSEIYEIATGSGTPTWSAGDNVFWNFTTAEPENANSATNVYIGQAKSDRGIDDTQMEIEFDGRYPGRTV